MLEMDFKITAAFKEDESGEYVFEVYEEPEQHTVDLTFLLEETYQKVYTLIYPGDKLTVTFHIERS